MSAKFDELYEYLQEQSESKLRNILANYFCKYSPLTYLTHGVFEKGADLVLLLDRSKDILRRGQIFFFQVKKGRINSKIWREGLHSQLYELYDREISLQAYNYHQIPRRVVLVTSGIIEQEIKEKIYRINVKHHLPIESIDGPELATLLLSNGYGRENAKSAPNLEHMGRS